MERTSLSFNTSSYESQKTSSFIYEPVRGDDGAVKDFRIVYASELFVRDWLEIYHNENYLGALLREDTLMDAYTLGMMERFLTEKPYPFVSYMPMVNLHLFFEPIQGLPAPYAGFYLTNITNYASQEARDHFLRNIRQMKNNAVLMRRIGADRFEPVFVSEGFARMMECSVSEARELMRGRGFYKTTNPEDRPLVRSMLEHRMSFDGGNDLTIQKITAKRGRIWCNVHYSFIDDFNEHYIYCIYTDVSVLKEHEERLRSVYSSMGSSFYQMNQSTLAIYRVNLTRDAFEEIKGKDLYESDSLSISYTESLQLRAEHFPIRSERTRFLRLFARETLSAGYLEGRTGVSQVLYSIRQNGRSCFVNLSASITRHPLTGDLVAFLTEQECNSKKVKETLTDKILAQQFDMVAYLSDGQYGVTIGEAAGVVQGSIFPTVGSGDYRQYLKDQVFPVLSGTEKQREQMVQALSLEAVETQLKIREPYVVNIGIEIEGETYYKQFDFYNIDPDAKFYILLKSDTTQIQKEQIARNEQLRIALEAANQANVAKTAFLSSMSHEIRTPMNAIIGLDHIALQDPELSDRTREHLEKIGSSAKHLLALINDILDMSRIESGRMTLRQEEFSFRDMLEQINTMINSQCQDKGLTYRHRLIGEADERYIGDDMKLKQVLINILGNAVKFTSSPGTVSFLVQRIAEFERQATIRFTIRDTGIGMEEEYLPRIFEAFSQENETRATQYGSTGLGMAITKNIVDLMNGNISVESKKGEGSVFTVEVTLRACPPEPDAKERPAKMASDAADLPGDAANKAVGQQVSEERLRGRRILLAEDMPINAEIMKALLEMRGLYVDHAENGQIALERFAASEEGAYGAILMDVRMPVLDGLAATRAIRALARPDAQTVPIIAMTANAFDEDVKRSLQAGMNAHLSKPVEPERLFATLEDLMKADPGE